MATSTGTENGTLSNGESTSADGPVKTVEKPLIVIEKPKILPKPKFLSKTNSIHSPPSLSPSPSPRTSISLTSDSSRLNDHFSASTLFVNPASPPHQLSSPKFQSHLTRALRPPDSPPSIKPPVPTKPARLREQLLQTLASESLLRNNIVTSSTYKSSNNNNNINNNNNNNSSSGNNISDCLEITPPSEDEGDQIASFHKDQIQDNGFLKVPSSASSTIRRSSNSSSFLHADTPHFSEDEHDQISISSANSSIVSESTESTPTPTPTAPSTLKKTKDPFDVAQDLAQSEEQFVGDLDILIRFKDMMKCHLPDETVLSITRYLPELHSIHKELSVQLRERVDNWENLPKIADVLLRTGPFLKTHNFYAKDYNSLTANLDDAIKKYPSFTKALREYELQNCRSLTVKDFMLVPVQRLLRYRLFMEKYIKYLKINHQDREDAEKALVLVSQINDSANELVRQSDGLNKLLKLQSLLAKGTPDLVKPGRFLIKDGELRKLSRREEQPRHFLLCSDCLMYFTLQQTGSLRLNHEISFEEMSVHANPQFESEFNIISKTRSIVVRAETASERESWVNSIQKALDSYNERRGQSFKTNKESNISLGDVAPPWVPDNRVTMCQICYAEFTLIFRRHHCRACGRVVCENCSANKAPLKHANFQPRRVCDKCFPVLTEKFEELEKKFSPLLRNGSSGELSSDQDTASECGQQELIVPDLTTMKSRFERGRASIRRKEVPRRLKEVTADEKNCTISGYMSCKGLDGKKWKKGWFVIKENVLYEFRESNDTAAQSSMSLLGYEVELLPNSKVHSYEKNLVFQLIHTGQKTILFKAENVDLAQKWVEGFKAATVL